MTAADQPRAVVVGTGLIGGSIGLALRARGWHVSGTDHDPAAAQRALELGALDRVGTDPGARLGVVATPVGAVAGAGRALLDAGVEVVTDVGSVKSQIVAALDHAAFVGGHPMAGSEQVGVEGSRADLFAGATWVLTPGPATDDAALLAVRGVVGDLGAEPVVLEPEQHDQLVAVVSHVPHLAAATLMRLADRRSHEHAALLRLAAGGFRDMTRIAAGHPGIWPDICAENREAIVAVLDELLDAIGAVRGLVAAGDRAALLEVLADAQRARVNLPAGRDLPAALAEVRIPVPDRPGSLAEVTTLASSLDVNIYDLEIAHSGEGPRGVLVLLVAAADAAALVGAVHGRGMVAASTDVP